MNFRKTLTSSKISEKMLWLFGAQGNWGWATSYHYKIEVPRVPTIMLHLLQSLINSVSLEFFPEFLFLCFS